MRAATRDPDGGEIPMKRLSPPLFMPLPCEPGNPAALCAWGVVSNKALKKNLMSEAMGIVLPKGTNQTTAGRSSFLCH